MKIGAKMKRMRRSTLVIILVMLMFGTGSSNGADLASSMSNVSLPNENANAIYIASTEMDVSDVNSSNFLVRINESEALSKSEWHVPLDFEQPLPDFSTEEVNLNVNARSAVNNAKEVFRQENNLVPNSSIAVLDEGIYHSAYTDKSWWYVKLMGPGIGDTYLVSTDTGSASRGWDDVGNYELQQQSNAGKVSPILSSAISKNGLGRATVIIVLKEQPNIRATVISSEEKFSDELNNTLYSGDLNKTKVVESKIRNDVLANVESFNKDHGQNEVISMLDALNADIIYKGTVRNHIIAAVDVKDIEEIANHPEVQSIESNLNLTGNLDVSTRAIHADWVWPFVQGNTYTPFLNEVSILDSGIDCTNPATPCYGAWNYVSDHETTTDDLQGHGTHVAGIVGSRSSTYPGVSPTVRLLNEKVAYRTAAGRASSPFDATASALQHSYNYMSEIAQYSYGWYPPGNDPPQDYNANVNGNSEISKTFDAYVEAGLTSVISAGNDGEDGFNTLSVPGDAFNVITVGSFDDKKTNTRFDDEVSSFSSRGYTGDGRTKPEVAAPGTSIMSTNAFWEGSNQDFVEKSGTSMAAPHVSGLAALLVDQWARRYSERLSGPTFVYGGPMTIRAVIYNSADETTGEKPVARNDRISGAGYVDAHVAAATADKNGVNINSITDGSTVGYDVGVNPGDNIKVTIVWNRHVNLPPTPTPKSVSDIDISILDEHDNLLAGSFSVSENWEKAVYTYTGSSPAWLQLRIYGFNVPSEVGTETVALAYQVTPPIQMALRAANGQYICAEGSGGSALVANRNALAGWETFDVVDLGMSSEGYSQVALRAANGQYVCAEGGGGSGVVANRNAIGAWETFRVIDIGNDNIALRANNGQYVCAEGGGGSALVANRDAVGSWEQFRKIRYTNSISLKAANGQYVCAEFGGGQGVVANRNAVAAWEKFRLIDLGGGYVALRANNGQYFCAEGGGGSVVVANRNAVGAWETFYREYR